MKSQIPQKKKVKSLSIVKYFTDSSTDTVNSSKYLRFMLIGISFCFNSSKEETDDLPLEKDNFWTGTLSTVHKVLNNYHDWRLVRRNQKLKIIYL